MAAPAEPANSNPCPEQVQRNLIANRRMSADGRVVMVLLPDRLSLRSDKAIQLGESLAHGLHNNLYSEPRAPRMRPAWAVCGQPSRGGPRAAKFTD